MLAPHISVVNLGCRVNRVESDRITADLMRLGFAMVEPHDADLIVINTCAVTGEAEAKTRKAVRHALAHPNEPYVLVTGCVVNLHPEELLELSDRVIAEPSKIDVAERVCEVLGVESDSVPACSDGEVVDALGRSRLSVKIQDGCNHRCAYCIVWKARGPERSVPVESVLEQVREAQEAGVPEVVLTGVNLGAYDGKSTTDEHVEIDELLEAIMERTTIAHVRISSVEPMDISESLLKVMARYPKRIAPFLHLPVQSGCTRTLHRMGRPYSAEAFEETVRMIRTNLPQVSLSCDVIVGFPGETEADFRTTYEFLERLAPAYLHIFPFSERSGTPAVDFPDKVQPSVATRRVEELEKLCRRLHGEFCARAEGTTDEVLFESTMRGGMMFGYTGNYRRVKVLYDRSRINTICRVRLGRMDDANDLEGEIVDN